MMRPGDALRLALRDLYRNSWRLLPLNALLGALLAAAAVLGYTVHALLALVVLAGPAAALLVHASVTIVRTGDLTLEDARFGLRHWRRGLTLAACGGAFALVAAVAVDVYARSRLAWPLAFAAVYLVVLIGIYQLVLWTLAIAEPELSLRRAARRSAEVVAARPIATVVLGVGLVLVNAIGLAAALMPFLTLTIAYSFLAAAHFALPGTPSEEHA